MFKNKEYNSWVITVLSYLFITIGILLAALALEVFLIPNHIIDGGITGISIILSFLTKIKLSIFIIVITAFLKHKKEDYFSPLVTSQFPPTMN